MTRRETYRVAAAATTAPSAPRIRNESGFGWLIAGIFIIGEMAGGGLIALPSALKESGLVGGIAFILIGTVFSGYTGVQLGDNWALMQQRWSEYRDGGCRRPYPEMAYRAHGRKAAQFVSGAIVATMFGIVVVFLLLGARNISNFLAAFFNIHMDFCALVLILGLALSPAIMLRSPVDFWPIAVGAMLTTSIAVVLILVGTALDAKACFPAVEYPKFDPSTFFLSYGTVIFAFGGHSVFPTIQHDMLKPYRFNRAVYFSYAVILLMYLPVAIFGYVVYGDSLGDSVIPSIQTLWIQQAVNVLITGHVLLTVVIMFNPMCQTLEDIAGTKHTFGWQRISMRLGIMLMAVFVAESVPKFGFFLDLLGGTTMSLMTMILPGVFNLYLMASWRKYQQKLSAAGRVGGGSEADDNERASWRDVVKLTPRRVLILNIVVIVFGIVAGVAATISAIANLLRGQLDVPCYVKVFQKSIPTSVSHSSGSVACCGPHKNITSFFVKSVAEHCMGV